MLKTNRNNSTVEENRPIGTPFWVLELILTILFIPIVAMVMWYLGKLRNPDLTWNWNDYLMNLLYSVFFLLSMRQAMQAAVKARFRGWSPQRLIAFSGLFTYLLLQTMVLFLIEQISDIGTIGMVYGVGIVLTLTYILLKVFLYKSPEKTSKSQLLKAQQKGKTVYIHYDEIVCIYTENKVCYAFAADQRMLLNQSLTDLEAELLNEQFFRINRQVIIAKRFIKSFKRNPNQTMELHLKTFPEQLNVSRAKTPSFIAWAKENS